MDIKFITSEDGDWIAMYINGVKVQEGHSISERETAELIAEHVNSMTVKSYELSSERAEKEGFPEQLNQEYLEKVVEEFMLRKLRE